MRKCKSLKKLTAVFLILGMLASDVPLTTLQAAEKYKEVDVAAENIAISNMSVYKDVDYSYLKTFGFGTTYTGKTDVKIHTAQEMISCEDVRIKEGRIVRTGGFYEEGDGGAGTYQITANSSSGSIKLDNDLYATLIPDTMEIDGKTWAVISVKQFGALGDGTVSENGLLEQTFGTANEETAKDEIFRAIAYIPAGEYKCTYQVRFNVQDVNIVGDGDESIIFTDNDYASWYEFFMWASGAKNIYLGHFRVEAREKDMSRYYRQFTFVDCSNVYMYKVNLNIPQEAFSKDYYVDKQYTNLTFYAGNKDMTVDDCRMELMCSTYRGANLGVLDFYCRGEENITVMNCELYDNARDEQIGIFTGVTNREASFIKNVNFINNEVNCYTPLDQSAAGGHRTMCFTVAYNESQNISNIRIAGNHFKCQVDSKFMTFGNVNGCVVEDNIIEADCTGNNGSFIFEAGVTNLGNVKVQNNDIYITRYGKASVCSGNIEFTGNRLLSEGRLNSIMYQQGTVENNEIISLKELNYILNNGTVCNGNTVKAYGSFKGFATIAGAGVFRNDTAYFMNNHITDYVREYLKDFQATFSALGNIQSGYTPKVVVSGNTYYSPNRRIIHWQTGEKVSRGLFYSKATFEKVTVSDNIFQKVEGYKQFAGNISDVTEYSNNTIIDYNDEIPEEKLYSEVYVTQNNQKVTEIFTTDEKVVLGTNVTDGAHWYTSIDSMAAVSDGVVTRKRYGDVAVFVIPENGSPSEDGTALYGKCIIHFQKAKATGIEFKETSLTMQPGKKNDVVYQVNPADKVSQTLIWTSSNEEVATVSEDGIITAVAEGNAVITAKTGDGSNLTAAIDVTVIPKTVKKIKLNCEVWYDFSNETGINIGDTKQLSISWYVPSDATNTGISRWVSMNEEVATVDENGFVTAVGQGHTEIRAYSMDDYCYGSCTVWVNPQPVSGLTEDHGTDYVKLQWDEQKNVDGYKVYLYDKDNDEWILKSMQSGNSYTAYGTKVGQYIESGKDYKFAVTSYTCRVDQNAYKHYYENLGSTVEVHTYDEEVLKSFGQWVPNSISLKEGEKSSFTIYIDETKYKGWIEDTSIATLEKFSDHGYGNFEVTGIKEGKTYMVLQGEDAKAYTVRVPIIVYDFQEFDVALEGGIRSITAHWTVEDTENINGFRFMRGWVWKDSGLDIPLEEIKSKKVGDKTEYEYTFTGLSDATSHTLAIKPYLVMDDVVYAGGGSGNVSATTVDYINVDSIQTDEIVKRNKDEEATITASVGPADATEPEIKWQPYNKSIASILDSGKDDKGNVFAKVKALQIGVTNIELIACDDNNYTKTIKFVVLPEQVTGVSGNVSGTTVTLNWSPTEGAKQYRVYRKAAGDTDWTNIGAVEDTQYKDTKLKSGTQYEYKVAACVMDDDGIAYDGAESKSYKFITEKENPTEKDTSDKPTEKDTPDKPTEKDTPDKPTEKDTPDKPTEKDTPDKPTEKDTPDKPTEKDTPAKPTEEETTTSNGESKKKITSSVKNFKMKQCGVSSIKLSWKKISGVKGYKISVYKNKKWYNVGNVSAKKNTITIKKLASGTKYRFRIRYYYNYGNSGTKYGKSYYCYGVTKPAKTNIKKLDTSSKKITVKWKKVKCSGYEIQYSTAGNFKKAKKVTLKKASVVKKTIAKLKKGKKYYIRVRAYTKLGNKKYYSSYSKVYKLKCK